jgi:intein-encoded DNA endonuclease-like protein
MDNPSPLFRMADRLAGGQLEEALLSMRSAGLSYDEISRRLFADHGIEVTRQTIANWLTSLDPSGAMA